VNVAIIGAGPLGRWLAAAAARAGYSVSLEDVMPANLHHAQEALRQELGAEFLSQIAGGAPNVAFVSTIEDAVRDADLAIDCVPDELESKLEILWLLDRMAPPRTVLVTPTKHLSITDLGACTYRADRCMAIAADASELTGLDLEPRGSVDLVLRTAPSTSQETIVLVVEFWQRIGFHACVESEPET
jgi:3-hydroxybutyryl-CoA dehydrogenase